MASIEDIDREIDNLGIRAEVEAEAGEFAALQEPTFWPGLGIISTLAAQMLADAEPWLRPGPDPRCDYRNGYTVHVKPWCRCRRGSRSWS
ncbi:MAG: hypothetical protein HOY79_17720 [Streptomyces sp.]|nr:hypothetical protein [Streptomyces sp.]